MKRLFAVLALLFAFTVTPVKADTVLGDIPTTPPTYGVYDPDNLLDVRVENRVRELNAKWKDTKTQPQIAVVIVNKLDGTPIEKAANTIAKNWKVGYEATNGGILVLVDVQNHKIRTEVSDNINKLLSTSTIDRINAAVKSNFKAERYTDGLLDYLNELESAIASATKPASDSKSSKSNATPSAVPQNKDAKDKPAYTPLFFVLLIAAIGGPVVFVAASIFKYIMSGGDPISSDESTDKRDFGEPTAVEDYKPEPEPYTEVRSPRRSSHGMRPSVRRRMGSVSRSALVEASSDDNSRRSSSRGYVGLDSTQDFLHNMMIYHILTSNNRQQPSYHDYERRSSYHNSDYSSSSSSSDSWSSWSSDSWSSSSDGGGFSGGGSTGDW